MTQRKKEFPLYAQDLPKDTHRRLRLASTYLDMSMKDFLAIAIENQIIASGVPQEFLQPPKEDTITTSN